MATSSSRRRLRCLAVGALVVTPLAVTVSVGRLVAAAGAPNFTVIAGSGGGASPPGPSGTAALSVGLNHVSATASDAAGNVLVADTYNNEVDLLARSATNPTYVGSFIGWAMGSMYTLVGGGASAVTAGGIAATAASLNSPGGVAVDGVGNVLLADTHHGEIDVVAESPQDPGYVISGSWIRGRVYLIGGGGASTPEVAGTLASNTVLSTPEGVATDAQGDLLIADTGHNEVEVLAVAAQNPGYEVSSWSHGTLYVIAGGGAGGTPTAGGGSATASTLNGPEAVTVDNSGDVAIADSVDNVVALLAVGGTRPSFVASSTSWHAGWLYVVAGGGSTPPSASGALGTSAALNGPEAIAIDPEGDPIVADTFDHEVEVLASAIENPGYGLPVSTSWTAGDLYVVAGGGSTLPSNSGSAATQTELMKPYGIASIGDGGVAVVDQGSNYLEELATVPASAANVLATGGDGSVTISWSTPVVDGDSPITDYVVEVFAPGASLPVRSVDVGSPATSLTVTGLADGTSYGFEIEAVNAIGVGSASSEAFATPTAPAASAGGGSGDDGSSDGGSGGAGGGASDSASLLTTSSSPIATAALLPPSVQIVGGNRHVIGRVVDLAVTCTSATCVGTAEVTSRHQVKRATAKGSVTLIETSVVADARYSLAAPHKATVAMALTSYGRTITKSVNAPGLLVTVSASVRGGSTVSARIRLLGRVR